MVYADYNGSTPLHPKVKDYLKERIEGDSFANPNASHRIGERLSRNIEKARKTIAKCLGAEKKQVIFNSGASEGIAHVFHSILDICPDKRIKHTIITSSQEHLAVIKAAEHWQEKGYNWIHIDSLENGIINLEKLELALQDNKDDLALVSIMAANNETGVIQPIKEIGVLCQKFNVPFFSDTTQFIGKIEFNFSDLPMDYAVTSSHKVGGLIGSGIILAKDTSTLKPYMFGGGQEFGIRAGTQNYIGIVCMGIALEEFSNSIEVLGNLREHREKFETVLKEKFSDCVIVGEDAPRLSGTTLVAFTKHNNKTIQLNLEQSDIFVTTSSACSDSKDKISHVLAAMSAPQNVANAVIRISVCPKGCEEGYPKILNALAQIMQ